MGSVRDAFGETVVVLNRNEPAFYAVSPAQYELMVQLIDDMFLANLVKQRQDEPIAMLNIDELILQAAQENKSYKQAFNQPLQKDMTHSKESRGSTMRGAHEVSEYNKWLLNEIQTSLDDSRPNVADEDAMNEMDAEIESLAKLQHP